MQHYNAHERPPEKLRAIYKKYQKLTQAQIDADPNVIDFVRGLTPEQKSQLKIIKSIPEEALRKICSSLNEASDREKSEIIEASNNASVYELEGLPDTQSCLLSRLLHRDLSDPRHKTNLHLHYHVPYPTKAEGPEDGRATAHQSFFSYPPNSPLTLAPKDASIHKPLTVSQFLQRKLRWVTLGGQYDWTRKEYPSDAPPDFPKDVARLLESIFPEMKAEAAIVNLYTPGDTLSLHRDVSEQSERGLVSLSIGCDGIFVIGVEEDNPTSDNGTSARYCIVRLRSGDVVYMSRQARFAWHGVPKILEKTCPESLKDWPGQAFDAGGKEEGQQGGEYDEWRGWMASKRINLNVRQMYG
ncbi:hypothetical protein L228DRAFT_260702 [Xylona heveae TC161]|uniref:mRNA N(6)-methyladenine demethylase n=1 Tax=Xylona heveae (strain CBS 132557 / TC161) TaxID=1328760 RepID=A0A165GS29_XYLHT|nr:hypothetical protein L228DRAFT_260702 [Xylona heveae TC161]KZF22522.1 hypothetical protein L228DRAFT_260702 [Xylona heveae TC161]